MTEYWEDVIPDPNEDGVEAYIRFWNTLHDFEPGERDQWGLRKCIAKVYRKDDSTYICNSGSHSTMHNPIDGCCFCKHGVFLHTSYDIPCGACEMGDEYEEDEPSTFEVLNNYFPWINKDNGDVDEGFFRKMGD